MYVCRLSTTQLKTASRPTAIVWFCMGSPNFGVSVKIMCEISLKKVIANKRSIINFYYCCVMWYRAIFFVFFHSFSMKRQATTEKSWLRFYENWKLLCTRNIFENPPQSTLKYTLRLFQSSWNRYEIMNSILNTEKLFDTVTKFILINSFWQWNTEISDFVSFFCMMT